MNRSIAPFLASLILINTVSLPAKEPKNTYQAPHLAHLNAQSADYAATNNGTTVCAKQLAPKEVKNLLGKKLRKHEVLQVTVENKSHDTWRLDKEAIGLSVLNMDEAVRLLKNGSVSPKTGMWVLGFASTVSLGFIALPAVIVVGCLAKSWAILIAGVGSIATAVVGVGSAAVIGENRDKIHNRQAAYGLVSTVSPDTLTIEPGATESMLLLVKKKHYQPTFDLILQRTAQVPTEQVFNVTLD